MKKHELLDIIPQNQLGEVLNCYYCELDQEFMGFTENYKAILEYVPKNKIIVDLGCYAAAQCYYFKDYEKYIGVDIIPMGRQRNGKVLWVKRFHAENTIHYDCCVQDFIEYIVPQIDLDVNDCFAVMSNVPDYEAMDMAIEAFPDIRVYYVGAYDFLRYNGETKKDIRRRW